MKRFILLPFLALITIQTRSQDTELERGIVMSMKNEHDTAKAIFAGILRKNPGNLQAKTELSREYMYLEDWTEAIRLCKELLSQKADTTTRRKTYVTYGAALDGSGDDKGAIKMYKKGMEEFPSYYLLPFNLGITLFSSNRKPEAAEQFALALRLNPSHASSSLYLATFMEEQKNRIASILALMRFLILEPDGPRTVQALGALRQKLEGNVSRSGENQVSISVDPGQMDKKTENNFAAVDLFLSLSVATQLGKQKEGQSEATTLAAEINALCSSLETNRSGQRGFFWQYYAPFFIEMMKNGHGETLAYVFLSYKSDPPDYVIQWVSENKEKTETFFSWEKNYQWPK